MDNKYRREIKPGVWVDVYEVLNAFNVDCPAMAHAIKKCLAPGQRGAKSAKQDKKEAIASIERSIDMGRNAILMKSAGEQGISADGYSVTITGVER